MLLILCNTISWRSTDQLEGNRVTDKDIRHAIKYATVVVDLDPDADPPKVPVIGPNRAGNLLEVMVLDLAEGRLLTINAMPLRAIYHDLLPTTEDGNG